VDPVVAAALLAAGAVAGAMNALAGGGTMVSFPALVLFGVPPTIANATSTVALLPGALSSLAGYWPEVRSHRAWLTTLLLPSLAGGAIGSLLLLRTPEPLFARLAPALLLFATLLFAVQSRRGGAATGAAPETVAPAPGRGWRIAWVAQLLVSVYGGFFGAGIGILMLAILGLLGLRNIHAMNGLKNFFGACINGVAATIFVVSGAVRWSAALPLLAGSVVGGYFGARLGRFVGQRRARQAVVAIGVAVTLVLIWKQI